jgi:hypothetical protein
MRDRAERAVDAAGAATVAVIGKSNMSQRIETANAAAATQLSPVRCCNSSNQTVSGNQVSSAIAMASSGSYRPTKHHR